ncbi:MULTISPECIES: acyl-CoA desaturase [unclassified Psychrobacter]|uniref:fatty acid desaturase family protein n=1 Tax=unclassified Psychrobacter TaxID=196806 RepID=UPI001EDCDDAD|nr:MULTISPECIES: acyl-CoA desaturase [unclassified Psychrobacter]MCG3808815.1 acyl-CoA desaturase [Psychrobacter sp. Ps4]MCG3873484.1 acyl-CoA desaturase [Psychrobacter sp. Ps7]
MRLLPPVTTAQSAVPVLTPLTDAKQQKAKQLTRYPTLTGAPLPKAQSDALAHELNVLYRSVMDSLGSDDARYIKRVYAAVVYSEMTARGLLAAAGCMQSKYKIVATWLLGTSLLSLSKILNNMELGHNVMHGQYDWMQHPYLNSQKFDWDIVCPAPLWQHSHNYLHHTFTNIVGRDHDVGYHLIRVTDEQPWTPSDRHNMFKTAILALGFEWAVAFHDIQISVDEYADSPDRHQTMQQKSRALFAKIARQVGKDHIVLPTLAGRTLGRGSAMTTLSGNVTANIARNLWTWAVIFCGHFTEQAHIYSHLDADETKGDWYVRQILGSSNIQGGKLFHILTGNLSHQIEHHIFPDMPASHYARIAPQLQAICRKYNLPYNTGRFGTQFRQMLGRIRHFSKPSAEEWQSYLHSQTTSILETNHAVTERPKELPAIRGLGKYLPPVMRQALFYA